VTRHGQTKKGGANGTTPDSIHQPELHRSQILRGGSFLTLHDLEFDGLSFAQSVKAVALNDAVVYEDVVTSFALDKSIAFRIVEPFHGSGYAISHV
jgi:hypothetical protein